MSKKNIIYGILGVFNLLVIGGTISTIFIISFLYLGAEPQPKEEWLMNGLTRLAISTALSLFSVVLLWGINNLILKRQIPNSYKKNTKWIAWITLIILILTASIFAYLFINNYSPHHL